MPDSNDSFMDGNLGLGMAIPEEATAALGPLPALMGSNRTERDEVPNCFCIVGVYSERDAHGKALSLAWLRPLLHRQLGHPLP